MTMRSGIIIAGTVSMLKSLWSLLCMLYSDTHSLTEIENFLVVSLTFVVVYGVVDFICTKYEKAKTKTKMAKRKSKKISTYITDTEIISSIRQSMNIDVK